MRRIKRLSVVAVLLSCCALAAVQEVLPSKVLIVPKGSRGAVARIQFLHNGIPSAVETTVNVHWDDKGMSFLFDFKDGQVVTGGTGKEPRANDCGEVYLDVGRTLDKKRMFHIFFTADGKCDVVTRDKIVKTGKTAHGWRAEVFVSWKMLGSRPKAGDVWGLNLNRVNQPGNVYLCWSPTGPYFDSIETWGAIVFADADGGTGGLAENMRRRQEETVAAEERLREELSHADERAKEYVERVTRGEGFMPWQSRDPVSFEEKAFREKVEARKDRMLAEAAKVAHPALLTPAEIEQAKRNIASSTWAREWFERQKKIADYIVEQPEGYIEKMIPELTPLNDYAFTCPNCEGRLSKAGEGYQIIEWDYRDPEHVRCKRCGHTYPSEKFSENAKLVCPRTGQTFSYYRNKAEQSHPDDRSGKHAWHWAGRPVNISYSGIVRTKKVGFMSRAVKNLALVHILTGDPRYARAAVHILVRLSHCYRHWLYRDYWDTIADADALYVGLNWDRFPMVWKKHLCGDAFKRDTYPFAAMQESYFGAGRMYPSTDAISRFRSVALAYDLTHDAVDADGKSLWTPETRAKVEKDLLIEWLMGAEPFARNTGNKGPRVHAALASAARCLGITEYAEMALAGYEGVSKLRFCGDGLSMESPAYTSMYLGALIWVPETLQGFAWPKNDPKRTGVVDLYKDDPKLRNIMRSVVEQVCPLGTLPPFSDTEQNARSPAHVIEIGLKRFPEYFKGKLPQLYGGGTPTEYAVLKLNAEHVVNDTELGLPDVFFPDWMTALLRHGNGLDASLLGLPLNASRHNHCQPDNLSLYYASGGRVVLGDQGYLCDSPLNRWLRSGLSHNLVVVDNDEQSMKRQPGLHFMASSPAVSVVEGSTTAYGKCSEYRRRLALIKGPEGKTFVVDIFRVTGGQSHIYRLFSEIASTDAGDKGAIEFSKALAMPAEKPIPKNSDFGLHDARIAKNPPASWQAVWKEPGAQYRLWMLTPVREVRASHGPGQETFEQFGRRVRYVDAVREGSDGLSSVFVAVHEPSGTDGHLPITNVVRLNTPKNAGLDAVALRIESSWGTYFVLNDFKAEAEVGGVRFQGAFGVVGTLPDGKRNLFAVGAAALSANGFGFAGKTAVWKGGALRKSDLLLRTAVSRPPDWPETPEGCEDYVLVDGVAGAKLSGFPVVSTEANVIRVRCFPLPAQVSVFEFPCLRFMVQDMRKN